ncbi:hypothetical protein QAD02_010990 [Eretmocerus hayati]|uniref:Uncharacterized protein n=1 Tax=Eretmocerus hayati TaxID=131215 RepID=A0ACC2NVB7_9HYME|nr:hypothetical protein QAD02_010990 [Eretmocerus hayati]
MLIKMEDSKHIQEVEHQLQGLQGINAYINNGENILHQTVKRCGQVDVVKYLLKRGANMHSTTDNGKNVIHLAVSHLKKSNFCSMIELIKFFIDKKVNVNAYDDAGNSALHYLAKNCKHAHPSILLAEILIQSGAQVNAANKLGESVLYLAVESSNLSLSKYLISVGASVKHRKKQIKSPLQICVEKCDLQMTKLLMKNCKSPERVINSQSSLLHIAIKSTRPSKERRDLVQTLLDGGADPNACDSSSSTPLHLVIGDGDENCAKILIDYNCIIDCENDAKMTPLRIAVVNRLRYSVELLLLNGADPNHVRSSHTWGRPPTSVVFKDSIMRAAIWGGDFSIVQLLWKHGVNMSSKEDIGYFLGQSASSNNINLAKFFLSKGADINYGIGFDNFNPLLCALCISNDASGSNMVQFLIDHGADVIAGTPLDYPRRYSNFKNSALCFIRHLALLAARNHEALGEDTLSQFAKCASYKNYFFQCLYELSRMMNKVPLSNFTPYEVLVKKNNELVKCIQNEPMAKFIKSKEASKCYPRYSWNLRYRLAQGQERLNLINKSRVFFRTVLSSRIPVEIVTLISEQLSNEDLINLSKIQSTPHKPPGKFTMTLRESRKRKYFA